VASSVGMKDYNFTLERNILTIDVNFSLWKNVNSITGFEAKLDSLLNLVFIRCMVGLELQKTSLENALSTLTEAKIPVELNLNFTESDHFKALRSDVQVSLIEKFVAHARRFLVSGNGLGEICKKDSSVKGVVGRKVKRVIISFDANNSISSIVGSGTNIKEYQVLLQQGNLLIDINLSAAEKPLEGFEEKLDAALELVVVKAAELSKAKLIALEHLYLKKTSSPVLIEIDWSFVEHPNFRKKSVIDQRAICHAIVHVLLNNLVISNLKEFSIFMKNLGT